MVGWEELSTTVAPCTNCAVALKVSLLVRNNNIVSVYKLGGWRWLAYQTMVGLESEDAESTKLV